MPRLRTIEISDPKVAPAVFAALGDLKGLQDFRFTEYPATDEILAYAGRIRGLRRLQVTSFRGNGTRLTAPGSPTKE